MTADPLAVLRRARQPSAPPPVADAERCDLCGDGVPDEHGHLVDLHGHHLLCACYACRLLFSTDGSGAGRYRAVPDRYLAAGDGPAVLAFFDSLDIPVGTAFFMLNSALGRVCAFYPGPAGATESQLSIESWDDLVASLAAVSTMVADVEGLLVHVPRDRGGAECFVVPIDACYELVGRLRRLWRGFDGGREAKDALEEFLARVRARAQAQ